MAAKKNIKKVLTRITGNGIVYTGTQGTPYKIQEVRNRMSAAQYETIKRELGLSDKEMEQIVEALEDEDRERR